MEHRLLRQLYVEVLSACKEVDIAAMEVQGHASSGMSTQAFILGVKVRLENASARSAWHEGHYVTSGCGTSLKMCLSQCHDMYSTRGAKGFVHPGVLKMCLKPGVLKNLCSASLEQHILCLSACNGGTTYA